MPPTPAMTRLALAVAGCVAVIGLAYRTAYIFDCRRSGGPVEACWTRGPLAVSLEDLLKVATVLGAGGAAGGVAGYVRGYWTRNPALDHTPARPMDPDA